MGENVKGMTREVGEKVKVGQGRVREQAEALKQGMDNVNAKMEPLRSAVSDMVKPPRGREAGEQSEVLFGSEYGRLLMAAHVQSPLLRAGAQGGVFHPLKAGVEGVRGALDPSYAERAREEREWREFVRRTSVELGDRQAMGAAAAAGAGGMY
eukprot:5454480-Prymnesium_polylepis.1